MTEYDVKIVDESTDTEVLHQLYVNGSRQAALRLKDGRVTLHWEIYGPHLWPEARGLLQGLLNLSVLADQLYGTGTGNGK